MRAQGIDISYHDLDFDPSKSQHPIDFVVMRSGYAAVKDSKFDEFSQALADSDIPVRLAYHYLSSGVPVAQQVDIFLEITASAPKPFHGYMVDFETYYNEMSVQFARECREFIDRMKARTPLKVLLYTNKSLYNDFIAASGDWHLQVPLWLSWPPYTWWLNASGGPQEVNPSLPLRRLDAGWSLWQYNWKGKGVEWGLGRPDAADLDVFNGSLEEMKAWFGVPDEPGEPEEPVEPAEPGEPAQPEVTWPLVIRSGGYKVTIEKE